MKNGLHVDRNRAQLPCSNANHLSTCNPNILEIFGRRFGDIMERKLPVHELLRFDMSRFGPLNISM